MTRTLGWHKAYINLRGEDEHVLCIQNETDTDCKHWTDNCAVNEQVRLFVQNGAAHFDNFYVYQGNITPSYPTISTGATDDINISLPLPSDGFNTTSSVIFFNLTMNNSYSTNCSLYINSTLNITNEYSTGIDTSVEFNQTFTEGAWDYNITCVDVNNSAAGTSTNNFWIDFTPPIFSNTNFLDNSVFITNITGQFNISDNLLVHSYNLSIDGLSVLGNESVNLQNVTIDLNYDISNLDQGAHILSLRFADGHTDENLKSKRDWNWKNGLLNDYLKFVWDNEYKDCEFTIKNKDGSIFDSWHAEESFDRFKFQFEPNTPSSTYTFEIETDCGYDIIDLPESKYKKWIILANEHWQDLYFNGEEELDIKPINERELEITISNLPIQDSYMFNSIGDLNIVTQNFTFYTLNSSITYTTPVFETDLQTVFINLNKTVSTDAALFFNDTAIALSKTNFSTFDLYSATFNTPFITEPQENISLRVEFNLTGANNTVSANFSVNQTVYSMSIDNCLTYNTKTLNFTIRDEITENPINGTIDATLKTFRSDENLARNTSFSFAGGSSYSLCISPPFANYLSSAFAFQYDSDGYGQRQYLYSYLNISNQTLNISLYLLNESLGSEVIVTVVDTDDNRLSDHTIRVKRFNAGTGEEITTEIVTTNQDGNALIHLVLNDIYYIISVEKDGEVLKLLSAQQYFSTAFTIVVDLDETIEQFQDKVAFEVAPDSPVQPVITNFSLTTISPGNYIEWFAISTTFNGTYFIDNSTEPDGGTAMIELNLTNTTGWIQMLYQIKLQDEDLFSFTGGYLITDVIPGGMSIEDQKTEWESFISVMWRVIVAVLISIIMVLVFVPYIGTEAAGIVGFIVQIVFVYMEWIPFWMIVVEGVIIGGFYLFFERGAA